MTEEDQAHHRADATLAVRALSRSGLLQLRQVLLGLTREIFGFQDRVCCIGGIPDSTLDTVLVVDVDEEFESVIGQGDEMLPTDVARESLERLTVTLTWLPPAGRASQLVPCLSPETMQKRLNAPNSLSLIPFMAMRKRIVIY